MEIDMLRVSGPSFENVDNIEIMFQKVNKETAFEILKAEDPFDIITDLVLDSEEYSYFDNLFRI